ncbi:MAG: Lrp/AsnC family transcriptional regulator [Candidatus Omnitrophica bacterium]|nr:Lrp/AsnC family transcriptional regulator [Candidatus Omnitrophota bacterium]MBU0880826.1 Lrp/AsnC family transcriptional regulator [Candidatus Omnitrophota bacterium]MBU1808469.1 Lrp/AsnC family transcriptional regulator [Candidatus Omnitrophota bacterium]
MNEIIEILERDARATPEEIAKMLGMTSKAVALAIKKMEKEGIILKYKAIINREMSKEERNDVRALIEVKLTPQKNVGFDHLAERIYQFPEVTSCYLMSGTYDLLVVVEGGNIHTVSSFVSEKLSPMEGVRGTVTHFILKKYKEDGDILKQPERSKRPAISL